MTTKTQLLTDIIAQLIRSPSRRHYTLPKRLTLAYTPGGVNTAEPGVYRLALSRRGNWPSEKEIEIVKRDLKAALKAAGRHQSGMAVEEYLTKIGATSERLLRQKAPVLQRRNNTEPRQMQVILWYLQSSVQSDLVNLIIRLKIQK